jgi:hypothetical protein
MCSGSLLQIWGAKEAVVQLDASTRGNGVACPNTLNDYVVMLHGLLDNADLKRSRTVRYCISLRYVSHVLRSNHECQDRCDAMRCISPELEQFSLVMIRRPSHFVERNKCNVC